MSHPEFYVIWLRQIEAQASIGFHAFELEKRQKVYLSVALLVPGPPPRGDDVAGVQDYDFVREGVLRLAETRHFNLQETLCAEILDLCEAQTGVLGAVVQTDKPDVYPATAGVACRMARMGPQLAGFPWWTLNI